MSQYLISIFLLDILFINTFQLDPFICQYDLVHNNLTYIFN